MAEGSDMSTIQPTQSARSPSQSKPVGAGKNTTPIQRKKYTMRSSYNVNVKVESDKYRCDIDDMCHLTDGTILLIDSRNYKLKRIDDTNNVNTLVMFKSAPFRVKDFLEFDSTPLGICSVSSSEVAVRLFDNTIQFISVNESLTVTRQVSIKYPGTCYYGLACCSDQFWVPRQKGVYIYSLSDGSLLKKIDSHGRTIFPTFPPEHIAVSNDGSMVYVTAGDDRVVVFNKNGDYIREFRDKRLDGTCGICITCENIVLVAGYRSSNVLMFDVEDLCLGELVISKNMLGNPFSVCYDKLKCRLLVGFKNADTIQVFDLG